MHATQTKTDYKQLLSRLCHLVALSEAKKIEGVVDSLVANVLEMDPAHPASDKVKVDEALNVYFSVKLDVKDIEDSISRLFNNGTIVRGQEKGTFTLSLSGRTAQLKLLDDAAKLEEKVKEQWLETIRTSFDPWTAQTEFELWSCLKAYLTRLFCRHGAQTALVASGTRFVDAEINTSINHLLNIVLNEECKTLDRAQVNLAVKRFLRDQTPERAQFIAQLLDGTFTFYTLFTDEKTQSYLQASIPRIKILLDTNFLFGVLNLHDNPQNQVSLELVSLIHEQKLPFELYYHEESLREMQKSIAYAEKRLCKNKWSSGLSRAVLQTRSQDVTGIEYKFHEANADLQIEPDSYFLKFRYLDKILNSKGFKILRRSGKLIENENGEEILDEETHDLISKYQRFLTDRFSPYKNKSFNTIKHDIIVWRATKALRKNGTAGLDVGAIFLSADQILFAFDWGVLSGTNGVGVVVLPSQLLQLLRPFIPKTADFDQKFAEVFSLPQFRSGNSDFSQITQRVLGFLASVKDLSEETAAAILADELLLRRLNGVEMDSEVQAAIESEILLKNAELSLKHKDVVAQLEAAKAEVAEKQRLLEESQQSATKNNSAFNRVNVLEQEMREKEQIVADVNVKVKQTKEQLAAVNSEKTRLEESLHQKNKEVTDLTEKLDAIDVVKARNGKILRVTGGALFTLIGWSVVLWLPAIQNWIWLQQHPHKLSFYFAAMVLIPGLSWGIFSWKGKLWAFGSIVLAVIIKFIGIL